MKGIKGMGKTNFRFHLSIQPSAGLRAGRGRGENTHGRGGAWGQEKKERMTRRRGDTGKGETGKNHERHSGNHAQRDYPASILTLNSGSVFFEI